MLCGLSCAIAIVASRGRSDFSGLKHGAIPGFGVIANLLCLLFYLIGPFAVSGMSWKEPYLALAGVWGAYGAWYFARASKLKGRPMLMPAKP
jgi:hypothetical protein